MPRSIRRPALALVLLLSCVALPAQARPMLWYDDGRGNAMPFPSEKNEVASAGAAEAENRRRSVPTSAPAETPDRQALLGEGNLLAGSAWFALALLWCGSSCIVAAKLRQQSRLAQQARLAETLFRTTGGTRPAVDCLDQGSPFHAIAKSGMEAMERHEWLLGKIGRRSWVAMSIRGALAESEKRLRRGFASLVAVGAAAPLVAFFGTVWGANRPPSNALEPYVMAAAGLLVAVTTTLGYKSLARRNHALIRDLNAFAENLETSLLGTDGDQAQS